MPSTRKSTVYSGLLIKLTLCIVCCHTFVYGHEHVVVPLWGVLGFVVCTGLSTHCFHHVGPRPSPLYLGRQVLGIPGREVKTRPAILDDSLHCSQSRADHRCATGKGLGDAQRKVFVT